MSNIFNNNNNDYNVDLALVDVTEHQLLNGRINEIAGNKAPATPITPHAIHVVFNSQMPLIAEEFGELAEAYRLDDRKMWRDAIADTIVVCDGMAHRLGIKYSIVMTNSTALDVSSLIENTQALIERLSAEDYVAQKLLHAHEPTIAACEIVNELTGVVRAAYMLAYVSRVNVRKDQLAVYNSNLSKFDTTREAAEQSCVKYEALGLEVRIHETEVDGVTYYVIKSAKTQTGTDNKVYPQNKFLKSDAFKEPVLI